MESKRCNSSRWECQNVLGMIWVVTIFATIVFYHLWWFPILIVWRLLLHWPSGRRMFRIICMEFGAKMSAICSPSLLSTINFLAATPNTFSPWRGFGVGGRSSFRSNFLAGACTQFSRPSRLPKFPTSCVFCFLFKQLSI